MYKRKFMAVFFVTVLLTFKFYCMVFKKNELLLCTDMEKPK